jgi:hypothetical protein
MSVSKIIKCVEISFVLNGKLGENQSKELYCSE